MFITRNPIPLAEFLAAPPPAECGASAVFVGHVRNHHAGRRVARLFYDCYEPLAESRMAAIVDEARKLPGVGSVRAIHRVGWLAVGEAAVAVVVTAAHRQEAFTTCRRVIDEIKESVPLWKKETYEDGTSLWAECRDARRASS